MIRSTVAIPTMEVQNLSEQRYAACSTRHLTCGIAVSSRDDHGPRGWLPDSGLNTLKGVVEAFLYIAQQKN